MAAALPPIISQADASAIDGAVWCDVRWYLDGADGHTAYLAEHIEGAIFVDLDRHLAEPPTVTDGRHPMPTAATFAGSLSELGIGPSDRVVAYDDRQGVPASRLVWMLRALGHEAALLDGGLDGWSGATATGEETRRAVPHPVRDWPDLLADADETEAVGNQADAIVIDARAGERFRGETEPMDARAGHIPGAINLPFSGNMDANGHFLSPEVLRERFEGAGISLDSLVVNYCGSGVSACHNLLAIERAGLGVTRLYPGSWSAWSGDPQRTVATGN